MRKLALLLLAAVVLLAGCKPGPGAAPGPWEPAPPRVAPAQGGEVAERPAEPGPGKPPSDPVAQPPPKAKAPPDPLIPPLQPPCLSQPRKGPFAYADRRYVESGTCPARIDTEPFRVTFELTGTATAQAVQAALQIEGPVQPKITVWEPYYWSRQFLLYLDFPAGAPGEQFSVRLSGPLEPGGTPVDLGFRLERVPPPSVLMQWRPAAAGGDWLPLERPASLPRRPLHLRVQTVGPVPSGEVERILAQEGLSGWQWTGPDSLFLALPEPPARLRLNFDGILTPDYVRTSRSAWELFTGPPPVLVAVDPATGQETAVGRAPLHAAHGSLSPNGEQALFFAAHPDSEYAEEPWVIDTKSGKALRLGIRTYSAIPRWSAGGLLLPQGGTVYHWRLGDEAPTAVQTSAAGFVALSADGRWLAGFDYDARREDKQMMMPGSLVLYDTVERKERVLASEQIQVRMPHSEFGPQLPMAFTPDGGALVFREQPPTGLRWRRIDLTTGEISPAEEPGQPDGTERPANESGYRFTRHDGYGTVVVTTPDGRELWFGKGLVLGWRADGHLLVVRWEQADLLRRVWNGL